MANDSRTIGEKLRAMEERAAGNKEPAEGSRENAGGISNRPLREEQERQEKVPPRGKNKEGRHA